MGPDGLPGGEATVLFNLPWSFDCQPDSLHPAPNNRFLIIQNNCQHHLTLQLLNLEDLSQSPPLQSDSHFLDWSADGQWFLYRKPDTQAVYLTSAQSGEEQLLDLPFGTYDVVFAPDGQNLTYAASDGLDLGSEIGTLNLVNGQRTVWQHFPEQIISYPRWSPDGQHLAYILMPDSNIPFLPGELWLADANGQPVAMLAQEADTGHGYPPVWSVDGQHLNYIRRENLESIEANHKAAALHSNIYQVDISDGAISQITSFPQSLVQDIAWTPTDDQLAFTLNDAIWVLSPGGIPVPVSPPGIFRRPIWLHLTSP